MKEITNKILNFMIGFAMMIATIFSCLIGVRMWTLASIAFAIISMYTLFKLPVKLMKDGDVTYKHILDDYKNTIKMKKYEKIIFMIFVYVFIGYCIYKGINYFEGGLIGYVKYIIYIFGAMVNALNWARYYNIYLTVKNYIKKIIRKGKEHIVNLFK